MCRSLVLPATNYRLSVPVVKMSLVFLKPSLTFMHTYKLYGVRATTLGKVHKFSPTFTFYFLSVVRWEIRRRRLSNCPNKYVKNYDDNIPFRPLATGCLFWSVTLNNVGFSWLFPLTN